mmetsp:Transcript_36834/g.84874  ORF Transcript_36834/g.84874 Transcript_36834/m.84874 type:complete len:196 (-) Transcript_36834:150-737(-)
MPPHRGEWAVDLCPDSFCGNLPFCCLAWCCPCIAVYLISEEARPWEVCGFDIDKKNDSVILCVIWLLLFILGAAVPGLLTTAVLFIATFLLAQSAIDRFGVDEEDLHVCCKSFFCIPCYLTQIYETACEAPPAAAYAQGQPFNQPGPPPNPGPPYPNRPPQAGHGQARNIYHLRVEQEDIEAGTASTIASDCGSY